LSTRWRMTNVSEFGVASANANAAAFVAAPN
jgi:hypothetical protein